MVDRDPLWLTAEEVEQLTARKRWAAQCRTLAQMGIPFLPNAVGRPLVERSQFMANRVRVPVVRRVEPNWTALPGGPRVPDLRPVRKRPYKPRKRPASEPG